ncbi:single-stranded DNA-binding protein [Pantoea agglomerans]|uniref:single-stranded DNA-binding protein n=1 Tax=Enterobacter agglomerans TaxID=549 RepID=UPI003C79B8FD
MSNLNRFQFIGNLTKDADLRYTNGDKAVVNFDIAVDATYRSDDRAVENTDFFRITAWDKTAENAGKYLGKGSKVYVEGSIKNSSYEKDGIKHYKTEFTALNIEYLVTKSPATKQSG